MKIESLRFIKKFIINYYRYLPKGAKILFYYSIFGILLSNMAPKTKKTKKKKSTSNRKTPAVSLTAATADKHILYQKSVQDAELTQGFVDEIYGSRRTKVPLRMREDFCGTALFCAQWVQSHPRRTAVGIDLDQKTLDWGIKHNLQPLGEKQKKVSLLCQDVLDASTKPEFDIITAFNFSYWVFEQRQTMLRYFKNAKAATKKGGVFILDLHGGPDSQFKLEEPIDMGEFDYVWDQAEFCPITHKTTCHIHFHFRDKSSLKNAFTYEWRLWTLPELQDILIEAGFTHVDVWFDENNDNDEYAVCKTTQNMEAWVAYIAAWK